MKVAILDALAHGSGGTWRDDTAISRFNSYDRLVQLNVVAMGLNQLGMQPMLAGENWKFVQNPFILRNPRGKILKASNDILRKHGERIQLRSSKLEIVGWGLVDESDQ